MQLRDVYPNLLPRGWSPRVIAAVEEKDYEDYCYFRPYDLSCGK